MMETAITFCPLQAYELERFLAFVAFNTACKKIIILALPGRIAMAKAVSARHPEFFCSINEYPLTPEFPDYYDPSRTKEIPPDLTGQARHASGVVLVSGAAVPFPVMQTIYEPPIKPHYNYFQILNAMGVMEIYVFKLNTLEKYHIPFLLDNFAGKHKGQRCFVVGNGPSLKQLDMTRLKNEITFGANKVYLGFKDWGFDFNYWGIVDDRQIELYPEEWENNLPREMIKFFPFEYLKVLHLENGCPVNTYHTANFAYPHNFIDPYGNKEDYNAKYMFSTTPNVIYLGWTVTYMLIQLAAIMGCNPICLIGMDHRFKINDEDRKRGYWTNEKGENHFHHDYSANKIFNLPDVGRIEAFCDHAEAFCRKLGVEIINATPGTALNSFPLVNFNALFQTSKAKHCGDAQLCPTKHKNTHISPPATQTADNSQNTGKRDVMTNTKKSGVKHKKVTVLLCTPDVQSDLTRRCLDSLFKNTYSKLYELNIIDNKWDPKFSHPHEMNKCLATLETEFMVSIDDDVVLTPGWLEALLEAADNDPQAGAVGCVHTFADGRINHSGSALYLSSGIILPCNAVTPITSVVYTPYVCSACILLRKTPLSFSETYAKYRFEVDYCYRLWEGGYRVAVTPHKIYHLVSQQLLEKHGQDQSKVAAAHENDGVVFIKTWIDTGRWDALYQKIGGQFTHPDWKNGSGFKNPAASKTVAGLPPAGIMLPLLVKARLQALAASRCGGCAVFGAGLHTKWLEQLFDKGDGLPKITAVLDDDPSGKSSSFGLQPIKAEAFNPKTVDAIILSTDCWQDEMTARCRKLYGKKIILVDLYEGLPPGPYRK